MTRSKLYSILFIVSMHPGIYAQPVVIPPAIVSGNVQITTLNLLDVTILNFVPDVQKSLVIWINFSDACAGLEQAAILQYNELKINNSGKLEEALLPSINNAWQYSNSAFQEYIIQTGFLPPGCYQICYRYIEGLEQVQTEACVECNISADFPFYLLTPFDESLVEDPYPILSWTPYGSGLDVQYHLTLTECLDGQSNMSAILSNPIRLSSENISNTFLQYPPYALALEDCKQYVWQVQVVQNNQPIKSSEIWKFRTKCDFTIDSVRLNTLYYHLTDDVDRVPFNIVGDTLRFVFNQPYETLEEYTVSIQSLNLQTTIDVKPAFLSIDNETPVSSDPTLTSGINYCFLNLKELGFIPGDYYLLKARNQSNEYYLYFRYF